VDFIMSFSRLTMIASAPVQVRPDGMLFLDRKFVVGMREHQRLWDGPIHCILWKGAEAIPFGAEFEAKDLGFALELLEPWQEIGPENLAGAAVVAASADVSKALNLAPLCRAIGASLVLTVEYTLQTRLEILFLDRNRSLLRKMRSTLWHLNDERRRRAAFRSADAVQFNGYPAQNAYARMVKDGMLYLDGRMRHDMMATAEELKTRAARVAAGAPLRIVHSGRLETMKGAQDLLPVAQVLKQQGAHFRLDIFGTGELEAELAGGIRKLGLHDCVTLHDPVDFETELVPYLKAEADVFMSCHRQADPSCSYLESLSCGLPVIGYDNAMWTAMQAASGGGWVVPKRSTGLMASRLAELSRDPQSVAATSAKALEFGRAHDFDSEFASRMAFYAKYSRAG
jgi:colanic acid/amylovoran biosynthesis glycosyltransferase